MRSQRPINLLIVLQRLFHGTINPNSWCSGVWLSSVCPPPLNLAGYRVPKSRMVLSITRILSRACFFSRSTAPESGRVFFFTPASSYSAQSHTLQGRLTTHQPLCCSFPINTETLRPPPPPPPPLFHLPFPPFSPEPRHSPCFCLRLSSLPPHPFPLKVVFNQIDLFSGTRPICRTTGPNSFLRRG